MDKIKSDIKGNEDERFVTTCIIQDNTRFFNLKKRDSCVSEAGRIAISEDVNPDTEFWRIITKLNWRDRSERVCNRRNVLGLNLYEIRFLRENITKYVHQLQIVVEPLGILSNENFRGNDRERSIKNFLYHIVAKGVDFYNGCIIEPTFCQYILGEKEYQDIYTHLQSC